MRTLMALCLICALSAACATEGQPQSLPPAATAQPSLAPALASSVLLQRRDDDAKHYALHAVDPATGETVAGFPPIDLGENSSAEYARSADGTRLAVVESRGRVAESYAGGTSYRPSADVLHIVDLHTQRVVTTTLSGDAWVSTLVFSPDASHVALAQNAPEASTLVTIDTETGTRLAERTIEFRATLMTYADNGQTLVVYGQGRGLPPGIGEPPAPQVLLLDAGTLEPLWDQSLSNVRSGYWCQEECTKDHSRQVFVDWQPAVIPAHDGRRLYIVHSDEARLTTVEFDTGTVRSVLLREQQSWLDRLLGVGVADAKSIPAGATKQAVLSRDGRRLYVVAQTRVPTGDGDSNSESIETDLAVRGIDVATGRLLADRDIDGGSSSYIWVHYIRLMPDGAHLLLSGWNDSGYWTDILDTQRLERVTRLSDWLVVVTRQLDGQSRLIAYRWNKNQQVEFAELDPQSFEIVRSWQATDATVVE